VDIRGSWFALDHIHSLLICQTPSVLIKQIGRDCVTRWPTTWIVGSVTVVWSQKATTSLLSAMSYELCLDWMSGWVIMSADADR